MASLTQEQQAVCDYAKTAPDGTLILIDAVAGSGKTTVLIKLAEVVKVENALYMAYNKAISVSSQKKFPSSIDCRTTHSLAYKAIVVPMKLSVGFFSTRDINDKISYKDKQFLVEDIKQFCLSSFTSYKEYADTYGRHNTSLAVKYLNLMSEGKIECTHDFYLKAFHMALVEGTIDCPTYGLLMLDEAGDLNEVTLEIFKLLPAKLKIAVGDPHQNIYSFNHTINCFDRLKGQGKTFKLSKSFRVPKHIAAPVEKFCQTYLDPDMVFEGTELEDDTIRTRGYISRTNSGLINRLIELNALGIPYGLVRKAKEIFKVPLMVAGLKYQGKIYDANYRHLQDDVDEWYENKNNIKTTHPSLLGYLRSNYSEDLSLVQAINLVMSRGKPAIFQAYTEAQKHENKKQDLMLMTAHSSKGLEFDEVTIAPDLSSSIDNIVAAAAKGEVEIGEGMSPIDKESLNLYYVAVTRALVRVRNATHL